MLPLVAVSKDGRPKSVFVIDQVYVTFQLDSR